MEENYFVILNAVNVNEMTEQKNGLTFLSWANAWGELKKRHPDATYTVYENADGWNYHTDGKTCWVKTGVTVNGIEHIEYLPVMDTRNRSIPVGNVTSFDVNKAIQRSLTKAVARHGLGLYIYAGEDLPEEIDEKPATSPQSRQNARKASGDKETLGNAKASPAPSNVHRCTNCGNEIKPEGKFSAEWIISRTLESFGKELCWSCAIDATNAKQEEK